VPHLASILLASLALAAPPGAGLVPSPPSTPGSAAEAGSEAVATHRGLRAASSTSDPGRFEAALTRREPGIPELHVFPRPGSGAATVRISFPIRESPDEAGGAQIIRRLADERMGSMARRFGAEARAQRTAEGLVYTVSGPASELDFLIRVLNEALRPPEGELFTTARRDQLAEVLRRQETPQGVLALRIRQGAGGSGVPLLGSAVALERMHAGMVSDLWRRTHGAPEARIVVVGDLGVEVALASLADLEFPQVTQMPSPSSAAALPEPRPSPEIIRHWVARAWTLERPRDARGLVAVALLGDQVRTRSDDYELGAELWEIGGRWTVVLSGAAYPRNHQAMRNQLAGLLDAAAAGATPSRVEGHAARLRGDILRRTSTPWGYAEVVGEALDAGLESRSIRILLDDLVRMSADDLQALFTELRGRAPVQEELRP
jgi:hypothetical protein